MLQLGLELRNTRVAQDDLFSGSQPKLVSIVLRPPAPCLLIKEWLVGAWALFERVEHC